MTPAELTEVATTFAAYRGARLESGSAELREFATLFGGANAVDVRDAIRLAAERDGRVFLETTAKRHADLRAERFTAAVREREAAKRAPAPDPKRAGWPVAPGSPTGAYLAAVSWSAIKSPTAAQRLAERYVAAGLVLGEHAAAVVAAMWPEGLAMRPTERAEAGRDALAAIDRDLGPWARTQAEQFVASCGSAS